MTPLVWTALVIVAFVAGWLVGVVRENRRAWAAGHRIGVLDGERAARQVRAAVPQTPTVIDRVVFIDAGSFRERRLGRGGAS